MQYCKTAYSALQRYQKNYFDLAERLYLETDVTSGTDSLEFQFQQDKQNTCHRQTLTLAMTYTDDVSPDECGVIVFLLVEELQLKRQKGEFLSFETK